MSAPARPTDRKARRFIGSARTNLPVWPLEPPAPDPTGRGFILLGLGAAAGPLIEAWTAGILAMGRPSTGTCLEASAGIEAALSWLDEALRPAVVGWRLMLAGPASDVLLLTAHARQAGLIDAEIRAFALGAGVARLQCVHCKTLFRAEAAPGATVDCPHCRRSLLVHQHLSRRLAALVAYAADVEGAS